MTVLLQRVQRRGKHVVDRAENGIVRHDNPEELVPRVGVIGSGYGDACALANHYRVLLDGEECTLPCSSPPENINKPLIHMKTAVTYPDQYRALRNFATALLWRFCNVYSASANFRLLLTLVLHTG